MALLLFVVVVIVDDGVGGDNRFSFWCLGCDLLHRCAHPRCLPVGVVVDQRADDGRFKNLHVVAVACPPVMDARSAKEMQPYITSAVNHDDVVPRASLRNARASLVSAEALMRCDTP